MVAKWRRRDFQILVVDRDDRRRGRILDLLTDLGFVSVQIASAPDSAASFADAQPPHIALVASDPSDEATTTVAKIRAISGETLILFHSSENEGFQMARNLAHQLGLLWDVWSFPDDGEKSSRVALELAMDRACGRLYYQFETEYWKEQWENGAPKDNRDPVATRDRLFTFVQDFSQARDLDSVLGIAAGAFSKVIGGHSVIYLRWVSIRSSFVVAQMTGGIDARFRGLGFPVQSMESLKNLKTLQPMRDFARDVFKVDKMTALLHGPAQDPTGLFLFLGASSDASSTGEFQTVAYLFDLTWSRLEAFRDRHALERVDRGTGLPNKRALSETLDFECMRARRLRHPISAALIEIGDGTPQELESKLGASYEAVLKVAGATLRRALRGTDYVARVERGRFAVLMPHTSVAEAVGAIDRMCRLIERLQLPALESAQVPRMRARAGVAEYPRLSTDADDLMRVMEESLGLAWSTLAVGAGVESGIRVMVSQVGDGFKPDFEPVTV